MTLPHTEKNGVVLREVVRQQQTIPEVLVISQFPGRTPYVISQLVLVMGREPGWAPWAIPIIKSGKASGDEPVNPIFNGSRRVSVHTCCFVRTGSVEDIENDMKSVEVSSLKRSRYFVLNGCDKCLCIRNSYLFHREPPFYRICSQYILKYFYPQLFMSLHIDRPAIVKKARLPLFKPYNYHLALFSTPLVYQ